MTHTVSDDKTSVAGIGAGVLGLCTALELSRTPVTRKLAWPLATTTWA